MWLAALRADVAAWLVDTDLTQGLELSKLLTLDSTKLR